MKTKTVRTLIYIYVYTLYRPVIYAERNGHLGKVVRHFFSNFGELTKKKVDVAFAKVK